MGKKSKSQVRIKSDNIGFWSLSDSDKKNIDDEIEKIFSDKTQDLKLEPKRVEELKCLPSDDRIYFMKQFQDKWKKYKSTAYG
ncbi:hypothetical protein SK355_00370 [Candidatus Fukatsuia symbiotica]|uniref:Uncharacterized protein n=1 Tax=Candidatus Fukatsuia symbiotica TaxID=1878942 RepID=A0A2U8I7F2_9GAMM|nr:hypothetical protein [Candidatus Fukatsuia symbiotica]AWK15019.1 hypothetical protein CCS41_11960 [Candidatus Fukatsuia symbiotica]MEA9443817.1 hypothetical protein [Candidatus Fukatsuia symbiotica]